MYNYFGLIIYFHSFFSRVKFRFDVEIKEFCRGEHELEAIEWPEELQSSSNLAMGMTCLFCIAITVFLPWYIIGVNWDCSKCFVSVKYTIAILIARIGTMNSDMLLLGDTYKTGLSWIFKDLVNWKCSKFYKHLSLWSCCLSQFLGDQLLSVLPLATSQKPYLCYYINCYFSIR